jgi:hypothetical protein
VCMSYVESIEPNAKDMKFDHVVEQAKEAAVRRRDVRLQSRSFADWNQSQKRSLNSSRLYYDCL